MTEYFRSREFELNKAMHGETVAKARRAEQERLAVEAAVAGVRADAAVPDKTVVHPAGPWPWGSRDTKWLRLFAEAAEIFWKKYNPAVPTTAPKNEEIEEWLVLRGASQRMAEVMATTLRADELSHGPRPRRKKAPPS